MVMPRSGHWSIPSSISSRKTLCGWPIATSASSVFCWASPSNWDSTSSASMLDSTTKWQASYRGRSDSGAIFEQIILVEEEDGTPHKIRRIVVKLKKATEDGDWELAILTNLPKTVSAV